jgi:hypothetical protein
MENPLKNLFGGIKEKPNEQVMALAELPEAVKGIVDEYSRKHYNAQYAGGMFSINVVGGVKKVENGEVTRFIVEGSNFMHGENGIGQKEKPVKIIVEMKEDRIIECTIDGKSFTPEAKEEEGK